jgi:predicted nucleotidyltransferase
VRKAQVVERLRGLAASLGQEIEGTRWFLFGSINRGGGDVSDIDLMVLCKSDYQADVLRRAVDLDLLGVPIHLALLTFAEEVEADAINVQKCEAIFP